MNMENTEHETADTVDTQPETANGAAQPTDDYDYYGTSEYRDRERRGHAVHAASTALSGTNGVTSKAVISLADAIREYIENGTTI